MKKISGRKIALSIIIILILLVIALFVGKFTFSYLAPDLGEDVSNKGEVTASGDTIIFNSGTSLSLSATTDNFKTGGTNLTSTTNPTAKLVASSKTNKANATYYVGFNIKNNSYTYSTTAKTPEILLSIKDEKGNAVTSVDGLTYATSGGVSGFDVTSKTGLFNVKTDYPITTTSSTTGTTHTWTFTLTFVNLSTDQSVNENASMNIDVVLQQETYHIPRFDETCDETTLACHVAKLYTGTQGDNGVYYHDASLANGAGDNSYRYSGTNPNNYVCFGSNESTCPTDNLYRIIGVFGNQVKLIKYDYATSVLLGTDGDYKGTGTPDTSFYKGSLTTIDKYYWNYKADTSNYNNTWSTSLLNKTNLNTNFITNIGTEWAKKIAETTWKVGGNTRSNIYSVIPATAYQNEIVNPVTTNTTDNTTEYSAKIGLMYVSDYGYAALPDAWTRKVSFDSGYGYGNAAVTSVNWMYMGLTEWTITRCADDLSLAFPVVGTSASVDYDDVASANCVRPSFNLLPSITYVSGSGSASDPMVIN